MIPAVFILLVARVAPVAADDGLPPPAAQPGELPVMWSPPPYAAGSVLYVAGHKVNLRAGPATDQAVFTELPLGAEVVTGQVYPVDEQEPPWYQVSLANGQQTGALFGRTLTAARAHVDLDQDGALERVVLAFNFQHELVLRVGELNAGQVDTVVQLNLGSYGDIEGPQDFAFLSFTDAATTGIPLALLRVPGRPMCGSGTWDTYVSYTASGPGVAGRLQKAVQASTFADAPVYSQTLLEFKPANNAVDETQVFGGEDEESGEIRETRTTRRLRLVDGVFVE